MAVISVVASTVGPSRRTAPLCFVTTTSSAFVTVACTGTADAYWAVIELGITVEALMVLKDTGELKAVVTADFASCVPLAAGAMVYVTTTEPAAMEMAVMRLAAIPSI